MRRGRGPQRGCRAGGPGWGPGALKNVGPREHLIMRSEEHTSELQSHSELVCRLLLALPTPISSRFPYTTLFRSTAAVSRFGARQQPQALSAGTRASDSLEPDAPGAGSPARLPRWGPRVGPRRPEERGAPRAFDHEIGRAHV